IFDFIFQAEDGIRYIHLTGVQTCALPIFPQLGGVKRRERPGDVRVNRPAYDFVFVQVSPGFDRLPLAVNRSRLFGHPAKAYPPNEAHTTTLSAESLRGLGHVCMMNT